MLGREVAAVAAMVWVVAVVAAAGKAESPPKWPKEMQRGVGLGSPEASILETLLPAENDVQVQTSVEPKERMSKTRTRIETLPLATPGQKIFPIPSEEGLVVKQKQSVLHIT